jgi:hypothetical protein
VIAEDDARDAKERVGLFFAVGADLQAHAALLVAGDCTAGWSMVDSRWSLVPV